MKKKMNRLSVLSAAMCITVGISSFTLPVLAAQGMKLAQGQIMEQEVPKEYMEDFIVQENLFEEMIIFLSEEEILPYKNEAEQAFKEIFGLDIPKDLIFDYEAKQIVGDKEINLALIWTEKKVSRDDSAEQKQSIGFEARFEGKAVSLMKTGKAEILWIRADNALGADKYKVYFDKAVSSIKEDLKGELSQEYTVEHYLSSYIGPENLYIAPGTQIDMFISEDSNDIYADNYQIIFKEVDINNNSGEIVQLSKYSMPFLQYDEAGNKLDAFESGDITEEMKNEMLEIAKDFLNKKEVAIRGLRIAVPNEEGIMFRFDAGQTEDVYDVIWVTVSYDLVITGYRF